MPDRNLNIRPFPAQKRKISQGRKDPYLLEHRRNLRKLRGHFLNLKPLISRTPHLDPRQNPTFSAPTHIPRRCDELSFLARRIPTDETPWIVERSSLLFSFSSSLSLSLTRTQQQKNVIFFPSFPFLFKSKSWPTLRHMSKLTWV